MDLSCNLFQNGRMGCAVLPLQSLFVVVVVVVVLLLVTLIVATTDYFLLVIGLPRGQEGCPLSKPRPRVELK